MSLYLPESELGSTHGGGTGTDYFSYRNLEKTVCWMLERVPNNSMVDGFKTTDLLVISAFHLIPTGNSC